MKSGATKSTASMTTFSQRKKNSSRQNDKLQKLEEPKKALETTQLLIYGVFTRVGSFLMVDHAFCHTYRTGLDSVGTPVGIPQRLIRHSDIRTTMNQHGDAMPEDMRNANDKVVRLAFRSA